MKKNCLFIFTGLFFWLSCLQGPWEYLPESDPVFRGLTVNAYIISGRPLKDVCIERLYALDEASTLVFPFYDSAYVSVSGDGGNGEETVILTPREDCPMCFEGPDSFTGLRGETYRFRAVIGWDSAGTDVVTTITAEATIPSKWAIDSVAKVTGAAIIGSDDSPGTGDPMLRQIFGDLPPEIISVLTALYLPDIAPIVNDTVALMEYFAENGEEINTTIDSLLQDEALLIPYRSGDTLLYLTDALNLASHFFKADYSDDVGGVLVTHSFEDDAIIAFNAFNQLAATFGPLSPGFFYLDGSEYRIQYIPVVGSDAGNTTPDLLEAIPVINLYFFGGKNTLYFYGTDTVYADFVRTYIEQHSMSNVVPLHSVNGAQGYFAGMVVDSFIVNIEIPPGVQAYTIFESRADRCADREWNDEDCRSFEPDYCREVNFNDMQYGFDNTDIIREPEERSNCLAEAVAYYLSEGKPLSFVEDSILTDGTAIEYDFREEGGTTTRKTKVFTDEELYSARSEGLLRYCIRSDFGDPICFDLKAECREGDTPAAEALFTWCEDNGWKGAPCEWAIALYCREKDNPPKALCEKGNKWCENHPEDDVCE